MIEKIYFGRPTDTYQDLELFHILTGAISEKFQGDFEIIDPSLKVHQQGYEKHKETHGYGMKYFFDEVLPQATIGVFLPFPDNTVGAGVWKEAKFLLNRGCPVFEIDRNGNIFPFNFDESRRLTVEDTRKRLCN